MSYESLSLKPEDFDFSLNIDDFDVNAAFQDALTGVVSDEELALTEKVRRVETIINTGNSEIYRDFIDFRGMASQIEMICNHDHALQGALSSNETVNGFMDTHHHDSEKTRDHGHDEHDDDKDKKKKKSKKKKFLGWFRLKRS